MYQVGPYEFTKQDARHTFLDLAGLWRDHVFGLTNLPAAVGERVGEWADAAADRIADHCLTSGHGPTHRSPTSLARRGSACAGSPIR